MSERSVAIILVVVGVTIGNLLSLALLLWQALVGGKNE